MNRILYGRTPLLLAIAAFLALVSLSFLLPLPEAAAQTTGNTTFNISQGIVGEANIGCSGFDCQLCHVVKAADNVISFMFYLGTVIAVLLFVYAGAKMMMAGGDSGAVTEAKKIFWNVVIGVIIMLCAYIFIDTIMKTVLSPEARQYGPWNEIQCVTLPSRPPGGTGPGVVTPVAGDEQCVRGALNPGISVNNGPCSGGATTGCTNLAGLPSSAINGLNQLQGACGNCQITITGGSEPGHQTHRVGAPIVDIRVTDQMSAYLSNKTSRVNSRGERVYLVGDATFTHETNPPHFHIVFDSGRTGAPYSCSQ